jgi:hypothetical protein
VAGTNGSPRMARAITARSEASSGCEHPLTSSAFEYVNATAPSAGSRGAGELDGCGSAATTPLFESPKSPTAAPIIVVVDRTARILRAVCPSARAQVDVPQPQTAPPDTPEAPQSWKENPHVRRADIRSRQEVARANRGHARQDDPRTPLRIQARSPSPLPRSVAVPCRRTRQSAATLSSLAACAAHLADRATFALLEPGVPRPRHGIARAQAAHAAHEREIQSHFLI